MARRLVPSAALFAGAALISAFTIRRGVDPFDEGLVLDAARRVSHGQTLYAGDFRWAYGPAQPFLLAGLFKALGVSLLQWRILRVLADAGVALVVYVLLRRLVPTRWALAGWLTAACAMAQPRSANPFAFALLFGLLAVAVATGGWGDARWRSLEAGGLVALAAAFRLDFALYALGAVVASTLAATEMPWRRRIGLAGASVAAALGLSAVVYAPFVIDVGPGKMYDALIGTSLHDREYWTLPFPGSYPGGFRAWPPGALAHDLKDVLAYYQPLLLAAGLALAALVTAGRLRARGAGAATATALLVLGAGTLSYLLSRTDEFHGQPLAVALAVLLPMAAAGALRARGRAALAAAGLGACVLALVLANGAANRLVALFDPPELAPIHLPAADGVRAPPAQARALERVVAAIRSRVPRGHPIYVAPRRADRVAYSNSILYVLADRDNAAGRDVGLFASGSAQRRIVDRLRAAAPRVVVRWTAPLSSKREPNLRGRSSGSHELDDYLASDYRVLERLHHYDVLVPRAG